MGGGEDHDIRITVNSRVVGDLVAVIFVISLPVAMDFLLISILAADVGSNWDVVGSIGKVSANVGVIRCGHDVMTGIVMAVVVRSSVGEEIRHVCGCGSLESTSRSSAIVENC